MKKSEINILLKRPESNTWEPIKVKNELETFQKLVGGYIEIVNIGHHVVVVCDEEGRIKGKPFCATINDIDFVGTVLMVGTNKYEFDDIPASLVADGFLKGAVKYAN